MRKSFARAAVAAAGLLSAVSFASAVQASDFSIDTTNGGSAWVVSDPGYLTGTVHLNNPSHTVTAYIGVINLHGQLVNDPAHTTTDLKVFCIDIPDNLANGVFTETTLANIESDQGGLAHMLYTSQQVQNLTKFLAYTSTQTIDTAAKSAAAQLGVWEIISEATTDWHLNSGNFSITGMDESVLDLAGGWLTASQGMSPDGYTLHVLDPGKGNQTQAFVTYKQPSELTPSVPEPATWGMIVVGFGLIGSALRRRQDQNAFT